ncbi:MAG: FliA/WhiG family RNA polymerase sigma factor [Candidatus Krumholzibacteria bacterium]|jgi:RNA polymerase sigma factor for flagellar operon FliA|nr:FliA/WhiG family RNA polymerase sigma factor [Candidatus Krumholzibacteria bacterium]MDP6669206.1 FliA/WhiG family RNA polymerase sigma factor [Candidatus Krumholzibacteria bacterium]MDP6796608.1 FliA/WhiG family RNA polymerase sigma factor [Candidatus Krumholzibacteria bacterium]MDP7020934.1 FliA/WhiG family RNA polymerase sigma factor [Candidatus Krumholzibacteria bacterium]
MEYIKRIWSWYWASPNPGDREKLVLHYLGLVKYVASRLAAGLPESVDRDDLAGAGMVGLMKAIESFDPAKEVKFETYALPRIRGSMLDELRSLDWLPRSMRRKSRALQTATSQLEGRLGRSPSDREVARHMELDLHDFHSMVGTLAQGNLLSLDEEVRTREDGTYTTFRELLADPGSERADHQLEEQEIQTILVETLRGMPERERQILTLYYFEELTLAEIGEVLGVTESRICQIHGKAVQRLRTRVRERTRDRKPLPRTRKPGARLQGV